MLVHMKYVICKLPYYTKIIIHARSMCLHVMGDNITTIQAVPSLTKENSWQLLAIYL